MPNPTPLSPIAWLMTTVLLTVSCRVPVNVVAPVWRVTVPVLTASPRVMSASKETLPETVRAPVLLEDSVPPWSRNGTVDTKLLPPSFRMPFFRVQPPVFVTRPAPTVIAPGPSLMTVSDPVPIDDPLRTVTFPPRVMSLVLLKVNVPGSVMASWPVVLDEGDATAGGGESGNRLAEPAENEIGEVSAGLTCTVAVLSS